MKKLILPFFNPAKLLKAYQFKKKNPPSKRAAKDLELMLYSKILKNDMLHLGYFKDTETIPEDISISQVEDAQLEYARQLIKQIKEKGLPVLDVGCGMGGLSKILLDNNIPVEALTPDINQKKHIAQKYPELTCHHIKFEKFETDKQFGTIINSESLQYIKLEKAFDKVGKMLSSGGRWIISDYFRLKEDTINKSGHMMDDFQEQIEKHGWKIVYEQDITPNILPVLRFIYIYIERFLNPLVLFASEKLKHKQPGLYYLTQEARGDIYKKIETESAAIDPSMFADEKKYMLYVLQKV